MSQYAHPETLVDTSWLLEHLDAPNIRIIEMDMDSQSYDTGHIPGSIFWHVTAPLKPDFRTNFEPIALENLLSDSGINNDTTVIAVNGNFIATSGWIFWLLKVFGHTDVRILNGGRQKWTQDSYPLTNKVTAISKTNYTVQTCDRSLQILWEEVEKSIEQNNRILLDARTIQEYRGELYLLKPPQENERAGHIPGAINLYYELAHNDDGTFKSAIELQQLYQSKNITPDQLIIPYCAIGARSAHTWFILKYLLGYPKVRNYDGSWNEWSRISDLPVAK